MDSRTTRLLLTGCVCGTDQGMDNRERGNVITLRRINHFNGSVIEITARQWHSLLINLLLCSQLLPLHHLHLVLPGEEMPLVGTTLASGFWLSWSSRMSGAAGHDQVRDQGAVAPWSVQGNTCAGPGNVVSCGAPGLCQQQQPVTLS